MATKIISKDGCSDGGLRPPGADVRIESDLPASIEQAEAILRQMAGITSELHKESLAAAAQPPLVDPRKKSNGVSADFQNQLRAADLRYRALVERIPAVLFVAALNSDEQSHELYVSPQIEALLGFSQEEWLSNPILWYDRVHPDDRERWAGQFAATCSTGVNFRSEYRMIARDDRVVWVRGDCQVIRDENGDPLFLQGIAFDITENKRA